MFMDEPQSVRILVHCDLDAFFASVEILHHDLDPKRPLIIGSDPLQGLGRGIVSTCNYAARKYGIRSAMPISEAWRRCPAAPFGPGTYIQGTRGLYSRASRKVMNILKSNIYTFLLCMQRIVALIRDLAHRWILSQISVCKGAGDCYITQ